MNQVKSQLRFSSNRDAEAFFDCPMTRDDFITMLKEKGLL